MKEDLFHDLMEEVMKGALVTATISSPREVDDDGMTKASIRPIMVKGKLLYQVSEQFKQKVMHINLHPKEAVAYIKKAFSNFKQGVFTTPTSGYHVVSGKDYKINVVRKQVEAQSVQPLMLSHNISKKYIMPEGVPVPFLVNLGIMSVDGKVAAKKYDKFRQINRFLEMVRDIIAHFPKNKPVRIVDFGCGKAYLTFALQYYLHDIEKFDVQIIGLDLKADVVANCNDLAHKLSIKHLEFVVADINTYKLDGSIDLMISLHACDTATDAALAKSVLWNAKVILCVPCCQHELFKQIKSEALTPILQHGILRERLAALATDAARAELLVTCGYEVQVLEFIDMEHTPKNLLIRAVKGTSEARRKHAAENFKVFKQCLGFDVALERLLKRSI